mgnify:FL=1
MNPAVSLALAAVGKFPASSLLHYLPAQCLGAWLGSALVLLTYRDAIIHFYAGAESQDWAMDTAGIFVTSPAPGVTNLGGAIDQVRVLRDVTHVTPSSPQVVGTALLLLCVSAVGSSKNSKVSSVIGPLIVAFTVMAIGISFGHNAG